MSGRGRGGRGGRGGGAASKTFSKEQLASLGIGPKETVSAPAQPPPLYPILERRPVPLTPSLETDYLLILRQDFIDHMQLSGSFLKMPVNKNQADQAIDKLVAQLPSAKEKFDWTRFPSELRPKMMAKRTVVKEKTVKEVDIEQRLSALEKLEEKSDDAEVAVRTQDNDDENEEMEPADDEDEEMDDGTDYANNYFDTGEDYEDEDDNLDDGAIY